MNTKKKFIGRFEVGDYLDGEVAVVIDPLTGYKYVIKSEPSGHIDKHVELILDKHLISPFLLRYHAVFSEGKLPHMLMEFCEKGNLNEFVEKQPSNINQKEFLKIFGQVVVGVSLLHKNKVLHRNINPRCIFLNSENEVKLAGWGSMADSRYNNLNYTPCEVFKYASYEELNREGFRPASDIFAMGCTMYFVVTKCVPFPPNPMSITVIKICSGTYLPIERNDISSEVKALIYSMIDKDAEKRPTIAALLTHPLLTAAIAALPPHRAVPPKPVLCRGGGGKGMGEGFDGVSAGAGTNAMTSRVELHAPPKGEVIAVKASATTTTAVVVIKTPARFDCANGLTDMKRDVLVRLVGRLPADKVRNVVGMMREHYSWTLARYFKILRYDYARGFMADCDCHLFWSGWYPVISVECGDKEMEVNLQRKSIRKIEKHVCFFEVTEKDFNATEKALFRKAEERGRVSEALVRKVKASLNTCTVK